jgi:hypothetical protein
MVNRTPAGDTHTVSSAIAQALAAAREIADDSDRADALTALAPLLPEAERQTVLRDALARRQGNR